MDLKDKMESGLNKVLKTSKDVLGKAAKRAKGLGDLGMVKVELQDLERKQQELYRNLGKAAYELLTEGGKSSVSTKTAELKTLFTEIGDVNAELELKEKELEEIKRSE